MNANRSWTRLPLPLPAVCLAVITAVAGGAPVAAQCAPDGEVEFICGPSSPEDLLRIPETPWVLVSSRTSENSGRVDVADVRNGSTSVLFVTGSPGATPGADVAHDTGTYASCPGAPSATYQPHGIAVREEAGGSRTLYVVGHGSREAVEVYALEGGDVDAPPSPAWIGCIVAPEGVSLNSVTPLPGGAIAVTNFNVAGGEVWEWDPGTGWAEVPGSAMSGPNGLVSSNDGRWLYIGGWGEEALIRLSRGRDPVQRDAVEVGFHVDNVRWTPDGSLLAAGQAGPSVASIGGCLNGASCEGVASRVARVDPDGLTAEPLVEYPSNDLLPFGTVAIRVGGEIWMGGIAGGERIAVFPLD